MAQREPNRRLAGVMSAASCSNSGLAKRVVDIAARHGVQVSYDHVNVKRWLNGTQPRGLTPYFIAEALASKLGRPVSISDIGMQPNDDGPAIAAERYPDRLSDSIAIVSTLTKGDLANSTAITAASIDPGAWSDLMVRWLVAPDAADSTSQLPPDAATAAVSAATTLFSTLDYQFGGGYARSSLVQYVNTEVAPLLLKGANSPELLRAAAALLRLTGWTAYDTGQHGMAQHYLTQALRLAQEAGDRALGGRILAGMSHQANFLGHHDHAANLARAARQGAQGHATPTAMALFHAMEARALAARGDRRECERALIEAERCFERRVPEDDPAWLRYFDLAELSAEFAHSYRDLGMAEKAVTYAEQAVSSHDPMYVRSISFCRTVLATGHLDKGEVDQGIALAQQVVSTTAALRSGRCVAYIRDFLRRLEPYRQHGPVAEFIDSTKAAVS